MSWVGLATMERDVGAAQAQGEDNLIMEALARRGIESRYVPWTAPLATWDGASMCWVRTVWDYTERPAAFLDWTREMEKRTAVWNPPALVRWNAHKRYLFELEAKGVRIPPTLRIPQGGTADVAALLAEHGELVVKPAVDVSARNAMRVRPGKAAEGQAHLARVVASGDVLVQPFLRAIATEGERSLVFFNGRFSHAVRKVPASGDYRVQAGWGGVAEQVEPSEADRDLARRVLAALGEPTLHARVDVVTTNEGEPALMELEVIEPFLFLAQAPGSVERLADAVEERLAQGRR